MIERRTFQRKLEVKLKKKVQKSLKTMSFSFLKTLQNFLPAQWHVFWSGSAKENISVQN